MAQGNTRLIVLIVVLLILTTGAMAFLWRLEVVRRSGLELKLSSTESILQSNQEELRKLEQLQLQKEKDVMELRSRLTFLGSTITQIESQLEKEQQMIGAMQENVNALKSENEFLTAKSISDQSRLDALVLEVPVGSLPVSVGGTLMDRELISLPITVSALQEVRGEILCGKVMCEIYIQDPSGQILQEFGKVSHTNFLFEAQMHGRYVLVVRNPFSNDNTYSVKYIVYTKYKNTE